MSKESEQVMALLNQLAGLKAIDSADRPRTRLEKAARKERQSRRLEIGKQIKEIARKRARR
jgi:hypothetical protein